MHRLIFRAILLLLPLMWLPALFGQSTNPTPQTLDQEEITVVGTYKPHLANAVKVNASPAIPETEAVPIPTLDYQVPLYLQPVPWQAPAVKPVALGKPVLEPLPNIFAKLGFGTQFSPLVEVAVSSGRSEKLNYGVRGHYTSSNGSRENQLYSSAGASLFGKYYVGPVVLGAEASVQSETVFFYGYNAEDTSFSKDAARRRYLRTGFGLSLGNAGKEEDILMDYLIKGGLQLQADVFDSRETRPYLEGNFRYPLSSGDKIRLYTGWEGQFFRGPYHRNRGVFRFRPGYALEREQYSLLAGLEMALDTGRFRLFPDLEFQAKLLQKELVFFAGWNRRLQTNSWNSLSESNPYLLDSIWFNNSRVEDRYAGLKGEYNSRFGYQLKLSQKPVDDFVFFVNDSADTRRFNVLYEDVTLWVGHAEMSYQEGDRFRIFLSADLRRFSEIGDLARPWHEPGFIGQIGGRYRINPRLELKADVLGMGPTWALLPDKSELKLRGTADVNLGASYQVNRYFTAWLDVNNLASFKHQRYYLYPSYGFRCMAGLQFSF